MTGGRREQEKGQNEQARGNIGKLAVIHAGHQDTLESYQDDESVTEDIIVEGAKELGREEGRKSPLAQQGKLVRSRQWP